MISVANGADAIKVAIERKPSLVLLDVVMPQTDGYTACREIRQAWGDYHGQIWTMTARDSQKESANNDDIKNDRHIKKPF